MRHLFMNEWHKNWKQKRFLNHGYYIFHATISEQEEQICISKHKFIAQIKLKKSKDLNTTTNYTASVAMNLIKYK